MFPTLITWIQSTIFASAPKPQRSGKSVWYFSYGSNMNPEVFEQKRQIIPQECRNCTVPGYVLAFSEGVPYVEPGFATCRKRSELDNDNNNHDELPDIQGVAFLISECEFRHVLALEAGSGWQEYANHPWWDVGEYGVEEVECYSVSRKNNDHSVKENDCKKTKPFCAWTLSGLIGRRILTDCNPSRRYLDIVVNGARTSGLSEKYCNYVEERWQPYAIRQTGAIRSRVPAYLLFFFYLPFIILMGLTLSLSLRCGLQRPPWIVCKLCSVYRSIIDTMLYPLLEIVAGSGYQNDGANNCNVGNNDVKRDKVS